MGLATDRASEIEHAIADSDEFVVAGLGGKAARL
jgi:hypothetical protein